MTFLRGGWICVMVALQRQRLSQLLGGAGRLCDTSCETSYHGSQALLCPKTLNTIAILGGMRQQCSLHVCWYTNTCYVLQPRCLGARVLHVTKDLVPCALPLLDSSTLECREKQRRLKRVFGRQHFLTQRPTLGQVRSVRLTGREGGVKRSSGLEQGRFRQMSFLTPRCLPKLILDQIAHRCIVTQC